MQKKSTRFGLTLSNIPLINLRVEFAEHLRLVRSPAFLAAFSDLGAPVQPIATPYLVWLGMPGGGLALLLQRAFTGLEAYVVGAARASLSQDILAKSELLKRPFELGGRGAPENYFNRVPAVVDQAYALKHWPQLWATTLIAYREVRNPLFHGFEIDPQSSAGIGGVFEHIADLYEWVDQWCDPDVFAPGLGSVLNPAGDAP